MRRLPAGTRRRTAPGPSRKPAGVWRLKFSSGNLEVHVCVWGGVCLWVCGCVSACGCVLGDGRAHRVEDDGRPREADAGFGRDGDANVPLWARRRRRQGEEPQGKAGSSWPGKHSLPFSLVPVVKTAGGGGTVGHASAGSKGTTRHHVEASTGTTLVLWLGRAPPALVRSTAAACGCMRRMAVRGPGDLAWAD